jgi:hypothetical protein
MSKTSFDDLRCAKMSATMGTLTAGSSDGATAPATSADGGPGDATALVDAVAKVSAPREGRAILRWRADRNLARSCADGRSHRFDAAPLLARSTPRLQTPIHGRG